MINLETIAALLKAHEELADAVEDFQNACLSEGYVKRLRDALANSRKLLNESEK